MAARGAQLRHILDVARAALDATSAEEFAAGVTDTLHRAIRCDFVSLSDYQPETDILTNTYAPADAGLSEEVERSALGGQHPIVDRFLETGDGSAVRISDIVDHDEWRSTDLYEDYYGPAGVEHQLAVTIPCPEWHVLGLSLIRADEDFSDDDRTALDVVRPFLVQGFRNAETRACLDQLLAEPVPEPDSINGAVTLDRRGRIDDDGGLAEVVECYRRLGVLAHDDLADWARAQRSTNNDDTALTEPLVVRHDDRRLVLRHVRAEGDDVALVDERRRERSSIRLRGYGLTRREADVLLELCDGTTNAQIAQTLGIARGTVKSHLENIYRKLGVDGRTAAVAMAYEVLGRA